MSLKYFILHFNGPFIDLFLMLVGAVAGSILRKKIKITTEFQKTCQLGIALSCLLVGFSGIHVDNPIKCTIALLVGPVIGLICNLDTRFAIFVDKLGTKVKVQKQSTAFRDDFIGFLMLTLIGTLSINGPVENVVRGSATLMYIKGCLDGLTAFDFTLSKNERSVYLAIPFVFGFDLLMSFLVAISSTTMIQQNINDISTCGAVLLFILGLNLLNISQIKTINLLPTIFLATILSAL